MTDIDEYLLSVYTDCLDDDCPTDDSGDNDNTAVLPWTRTDGEGDEAMRKTMSEMASDLTDEERELLLRGAWHGVLAKGGHKTGLWAHPGLRGIWKSADAVELQKWREAGLHLQPSPSVTVFSENELGEALLQKINRKLPEEVREAYIARSEKACEKWGPLVLHWCEEQRDEARTEVERLLTEMEQLRPAAHLYEPGKEVIQKAIVFALYSSTAPDGPLAELAKTELFKAVSEYPHQPVEVDIATGEEVTDANP